MLASTCMRGRVPAVLARRNGGGPEQAHEVEAQMEETQPRMYRGQTRSELERKMGLRSEERVLKKKMNMRHFVKSAVDQPVAHRWEFGVLTKAHEDTKKEVRVVEPTDKICEETGHRRAIVQRGSGG